MAVIHIEPKGCRGCTLCVDTCPTQVFQYDDSKDLALVVRPEDCIGCFSCFYMCPSQCITISEVHMQRPFYRIEENVALVERFLQEKPVSAVLGPEDWQEARGDVASTLLALSKASEEMMGRGTRALGRKAGTLAAAHLPEVYEETTLQGVLERLQARFRHCFDFDFRVAGEEVDLTFSPCGLNVVVTQAGETVGKAITCQLFHEYLTGLIGAFTGAAMRYEVAPGASTCTMKLSKQ